MKKKNNFGFSLIEIMLVLVIMATFTMLKMNDIKQEMLNIKSENTAQQIKQVASATNAFINLNYEKITSLNNAPKLNMSCDKTTSLCNISLKSLVDLNLLPSGYNNKNIASSDFKILLKREGELPNYMVNGIVYLNEEIKNEGKFDPVLNGSILRNLGIDGGISKNNEINGYGGSWKRKLIDYKLPNKNNLLMMNVGYSANMYSVYLRRDGTLPMTGNLNLGNNSINNIKDINMTGALVGNSINANTGNVKNLNTENIINKIKFDSSGINLLTGSNTFSGQTTINGTYFNINTNDTTFSKNVAINGVLNAKGASNFNGVSTFNNQSNFNGNVVANKNVDLGTVKVNNTLNINGKTTMNNSLDIKNGGTISLSNGSIIASGNITSSGNVNANYLKANSTNVAGSACSELGTISKNKEGMILSCVSGKWSQISGSKPKIDIYRVRSYQTVTADACMVSSISTNSGGGSCNADDIDNRKWNLHGSGCRIVCMTWQ